MKINPGTVLNGRYEILAEIGEGGFATVYRGHDIQLNRELAIKILKTAGLGESLPRFQREAKLLGSLKHKNIVSVFAFDLFQQEVPFIAMEFLQGKSLAQLIEKEGALDFELFKTILMQVCSGLSYAHKAGAIHRDLSPMNIFLTGDEREPLVKILDFGLSRIFGEDTGAALTTTGMLLGNPPYMSPEQARGASLDQASDIYSLGAVFYECFTGKTPFYSDSLINVLALQQTEYPAEPDSNWKKREDKELIKSILLRCLQKEPSKRFQACDEILYALSNGSMNDGKAIDKDLHSWSGKNTKYLSLSEKNLKWLASGLGVLLLCLAFAVFRVQIFETLINFEISANLPVLAGFEQAQADSFKRGHNERLAALLYRHCGAAFETQHNMERAKICNLGLADCLLHEGNIEGFKSEMARTLKSLESSADSKEKALLLSKLWHLLKDASSSHPAFGYYALQDNTLKQILASRYKDKSELRKFFSSFLGNVSAASLANRDDLLALTRLSIRFLGNAPIRLSNSDKSLLDSVAAYCLTSKRTKESFDLINARIAAARSTEEEIPRLAYQLASQTTDPNKALALLAQVSHDPEAKTKVRVLAIILEVELLMEKKHDYVAAIKNCNLGLECSRGEAYTQKTLPPLLSSKMISLYKLGRRSEILSISTPMIESLWDSGVQDDLTMEALNRVVTVADHTERQNNFQKTWLMCVKALLETEQSELAISQINKLSSILKQKNYRLDPQIAVELETMLKSSKNPALKQAIKQLLLP